jgi:pimeloyl-ACP methyl ester carboxylesterase
MAGEGEPILMLHGLGGTKASFLPSIAALAPHGRRVIAADLPGFGHSAKPIAARYDPKFFSQAVVALMDALGLNRTDIVGHSLGGRVTLEVVMYAPERFRHAVLMTPSLAWLRERPLARWLRLVRPELGLLQPAPRPELFWDRLRHLEPPALFVWGSRDPVVPAAFERHVREAVPQAKHVTLNCGHIPQIERPDELHAAIRGFLGI